MESAEPYREFIREMTVRIERVMRDFTKQAERDREQAACDRALYLARFDDLREESRAQTQALLRMIDRLDRGNGGTASA